MKLRKIYNMLLRCDNICDNGGQVNNGKIHAINPDGTGKSPRLDRIAMFQAALVAAVLSGLSPRLTTAHPVSLTRATAFVERETMTVAIEVLL